MASTLGLATLIRKIPPEVARDVEAEFRKRAEANGRTVKGYQLSSKVAKATITEDGMSLLVHGYPAGFWVWRESGTQPHIVAPRKKKAMSGALDHPISKPIGPVSMPGRGMWTKTVTEFDREYDRIVEAALARVWK